MRDGGEVDWLRAAHRAASGEEKAAVLGLAGRWGGAPTPGPRPSSRLSNMNQAGLQDTSHPRLHPRLPQACSLRRRDSRVHSELSVDTHAPEAATRSATRRAGRPTGVFEQEAPRKRLDLARSAQPVTDQLSPYAAALARFYHASGTADRVRRQALKDKRGRSRLTAREVTVDCEGAVSNLHLNQPMTNHQAAATRAAREAGWTLKTHLDELEMTLEQQLEHEAMSLAYIREEVMKRGGLSSQR